MENELKFIFPQVVLHNFGIEFNQKITGDVFNKLRARNIGLAEDSYSLEPQTNSLTRG